MAGPSEISSVVASLTKEVADLKIRVLVLESHSVTPQDKVCAATATALVGTAPIGASCETFSADSIVLASAFGGAFCDAVNRQLGRPLAKKSGV